MAETISNKVRALDDQTGSIYDFYSHLPYPTLQKIYDDTGINLTLLEGSSLQAESKIKLFVRKAFQILSYGKIEKTSRDLEYLVATDIHFRSAFVEYVINLIGDIFVSGNKSILMSSDSESAEELRQRARLYHSGLLDAPKYIVGSYEYREGY